MQALAAEGVPAHRAHNNPVYRYPIFRNNAFGRTGCRISCSFYGKPVDYSKVSCPVAERVHDSEIIALGRDPLLKKESVDKILEAIHKIKENINELK